MPPPGKQSSAAGNAPARCLTKEEIEKELDAYRHEDGFTFRIMRPPRIVLCKEKGEKWQGLEKIERVDLCCTARNYNPSCPARRTVDRDPATGRIIEVRSIGEHIDLGRKRASRADSDVRRRAKQLVQDNARPADAEQVGRRRRRRSTITATETSTTIRVGWLSREAAEALAGGCTRLTLWNHEPSTDMALEVLTGLRSLTWHARESSIDDVVQELRDMSLLRSTRNWSSSSLLRVRRINLVQSSSSNNEGLPQLSTTTLRSVTLLSGAASNAWS